MAPPAGTIRPGRYLAIFLLIVGVLYALVFFTGDRQSTPRLGIDLKGGTSVTLTARTPDGSEPSRESLDTARAIIGERVDGLGVGGAEVILDGRQIIITVPGAKGEQAKTLGQTAKLAFRKVLDGPFPVSKPGADDKGGAGSEDKKDDKAGNGDSGKVENGDGDSGGGSAVAGAVAQDDESDADNATQDDGSIDADTRKVIEKHRKARQAKELAAGAQTPEGQAALAAAIALMDCSENAEDPLRGNDDPDKPLVACDKDSATKDGGQAYVLGPVVLDGTMIADASSGVNQQGAGYQVNLDFTTEGGGKWAEITQENVGRQVAFVLDTEVVSAPTIQEVIAGGSTRITGSFSKTEAADLAEILKYGSLPLSFTLEDAGTVSATLGLSSLKAGLIAGAIGFALIVLYSVFYYRLLGLLLIASLGLTAALVFPVIILLGRSVGYTLDIAGVAGLIIAIGVTADSFIVYFERLKDEIRMGRTVRSAVPRAWVRARRTILSADAVVFMAAFVLYILAIREVKGFAFTIGLTTVLDLLIVFMVTHPMLVMAGKWRILNNRALSGLGLVQDAGAAEQARRKARVATAKGV